MMMILMSISVKVYPVFQSHSHIPRLVVSSVPHSWYIVLTISYRLFHADIYVDAFYPLDLYMDAGQTYDIRQ